MPDGVPDLDELETGGRSGAAKQVVLKKQQVVTKNYEK
jgi:hypothetical protein